MPDAGRIEDDDPPDWELVCHGCRRRWMESPGFMLSGRGCPNCGAGPHLIYGWDHASSWIHRPRLADGLTHLSPRVLDRMRLQGILQPRSAGAKTTKNRTQPGKCFCGGWIATEEEGAEWRRRLRRAERRDVLFCPF
jgi:hypothetical protein